jgi:hypothetical protein
MTGLAQDIFSQYQVQLQGEWPAASLSTLFAACDSFFQAVLPRVENIQWIEGWVIQAAEIQPLGLTSKGLIRFKAASITPWTVVHEFGHAWDFGYNLRLSNQIRSFTQSWGPIPVLHELFPDEKLFWYRPGSLPPPCGKDRNFNRLEDFAEAVTAFVFPEDAKQRAASRGMGYDLYGYDDYFATPRGRFIQNLILNGNV